MIVRLEMPATSKCSDTELFTTVQCVPHRNAAATAYV